MRASSASTSSTFGRPRGRRGWILMGGLVASAIDEASFRPHVIFHFTNPLDNQRNAIARTSLSVHGTNRRSTGNDIAGIERGDLASPCDQFISIPQHKAAVGLVELLAVDLSAHPEIQRIQTRRYAWAHLREGVELFSKEVGTLARVD